MEQENIQTSGTAKFPILKQGPVTADKNIQMKNDVKAKSMLLMALLNEYLMTFNQYKDAKSFFDAITTRFDGNNATRKTQKTLLKQMYKKFSAKSTDKKIAINGSDTAETTRRIVNVEDTSSKAMVAIDGAGFDWSYMDDDEAPISMAFMDFSDSEYDELRVEFNKSECNLANYKRGLAYVEEQLNHYKKNESLLNENNVVLKRDILIKDSEIAVLKNKLEKICKEKDDLDNKIEKFENESQSLDKLIGSQITDKSKRGFRYVSYNVVSPPQTGRFSPPRIDLSYTGLPEFTEPSVQSYEVKPIEVVTQTSNVKISEPIKEKNGAPIIEYWESKREDELESSPEIERKTVEPSVDKVEADIPSIMTNMRRDQSNWNNMKSYQLVPKAVLTRTGLKPVNSVRPVNTKGQIREKLEYSVARTPQQNRVTERRNRTLIEAARTIDGPKWLFNIDALTESMNYVPVIVVDVPQGKRAIGTKWVFRNKKDERGIVIRNQARLVAQGFTQEEGINYDEVFTHVARIKAIRLFLAYASFMGFLVYQMDVTRAFLYERIKEEVYVCQPPGFEDTEYPDKVYKVEKALYGLYQAPRAWYETLAKYLLDNGFHRGKIDQTLFIKRQKVDILLVQVYVDDIIFGSTKKELCTNLRS
nr:putative ribonuclease H-like domain-containing protein [Tanacetum cinerariifolium]